MKLSYAGRALAILLLITSMLAANRAGAQNGSIPCQLSVSDSGSILTVGTQGSIQSTLTNAPSGDTRTVGVKFEILQGAADFAGSPSPVLRPVTLPGTPSTPVDLQVGITARAAGLVQVRVTWLDTPELNASALRCGGLTVEPHSFDLLFDAQAAPRTLLLGTIAGAGQQLVEGAQSSPVIVQVSSSDGSSTSGLPVLFEVDPAGALVLSANRVLTDSEGKAQITARAVRPGSVSVRARLENQSETAPISIPITVTARLAGAQLSATAGSGQRLVLDVFSQPLRVTAQNASGAALPNAVLNWRVEPASAATLEQTSSTTDSSGLGQNRVRANQAGDFVVIAVLADVAAGDLAGATARFSLSAGSVPAGSTLSIISGNNQNLVPGLPSAPLVVELRNPQGQPVAGARLRFSANPDIGGVFNPAEVVTGADGRASTRVAAQLPIGVTITVAAIDDPSIKASFSIRGGTAFLDNLNPNQRGVATAIDNACPSLFGMQTTLGGAQQDLLARCSEIVGAAAARPGEVRNVLDQLLPDESAPQATASLNIRDAQLRNLDVRMDALRSGARPNALAGLSLQTRNGALPLDLLSQLANGVQEDTDDPTAGGLISPWGAFLTGTIGRVDRDVTANNPGFDGDTLSLTGGIDYRFSNRLVAGLALGYDDNEIELFNNAGAIDTRSLTLSLYGSYASEQDFYVDGRLSAGQLDFDLQRNIRYSLGATPIDVTALAAPEGDSRLFALTLGRNFNRNAWNYGGYLRGELSTIELDGYQEVIRQTDRAGAGLAVQIDARELDSRTATLGGRLGYTSSRDWGVLLPFARVEWVHEFEDEAQTVVARFVNDPTATPIVINGDVQDDGYGNLAFGLSGVFANGRSLFVQYERRFGQEAIDRDSLSIGGRFEF